MTALAVAHIYVDGSGGRALGDRWRGVSSGLAVFVGDDFGQRFFRGCFGSMVSTDPSLLNEWENLSLHQVDRIDASKRITTLSFERDLELEEEIKVRFITALSTM